MRTGARTLTPEEQQDVYHKVMLRRAYSNKALALLYECSESTIENVVRYQEHLKALERQIREDRDASRDA